MHRRTDCTQGLAAEGAIRLRVCRTGWPRRSWQSALLMQRRQAFAAALPPHAVPSMLSAQRCTQVEQPDDTSW